MQQSSSSSSTTLQAQANNTKYPQENNNLHGQSDGIGHLQQVATTQRTQQEQLFQVQSPSPHDSAHVKSNPPVLNNSIILISLCSPYN